MTGSPLSGIQLIALLRADGWRVLSTAQSPEHVGQQELLGGESFEEVRARVTRLRGVEGWLARLPHWIGDLSGGGSRRLQDSAESAGTVTTGAGVQSHQFLVKRIREGARVALIKASHEPIPDQVLDDILGERQSGLGSEGLASLLKGRGNVLLRAEAGRNLGRLYLAGLLLLLFVGFPALLIALSRGNWILAALLLPGIVAYAILAGRMFASATGAMVTLPIRWWTRYRHGKP
jgi:hypothetical protein